MKRTRREAAGFEPVLDLQYETYARLLAEMRLPVDDMPTRADVEALLTPPVRDWLMVRARTGHHDDLVLAPSVRRLGGWRRFRELIDGVPWAVFDDRAPTGPFRYPLEPPERRPPTLGRLSDGVRGALGRPRRADAIAAERARYAARHDDGQRADWLVGFVLDTRPRPDRPQEERGLHWTTLHWRGQAEAIRKADEEEHRPHGRRVGSLTVPQYFVWQAMRHRTGVLPADTPTEKPFHDMGTSVTVRWGTRFPYCPTADYRVPTADHAYPFGRTDVYGLVGSASPDGVISVRAREGSDRAVQHEGVRLVLRLA